jgi:hypothetical protein
MAKEKAIYAPGELDKVRGRLGSMDPAEAKRMAQVLGGQVGVERPAPPPEAGLKRPKAKQGTPEGKGGGRPPAGSAAARPESAAKAQGGKDGGKKAKGALAPGRLSYRERVRMDKYAGQMEFEIKSSGQVLKSVLSIFGEPPDFISSFFITRRLNEYYKRIELLVTSTRAVFPRNNPRRNEQIKKASPFYYTVLDTIRYWNIERITSEMARLQGRPRNVRTVDLAEILRAVYKPLFLLERLDMDAHIKEAYKLLYKIIYLESPDDAKRYQEQIRAALSSFNLIRKDIQFLMYPLLLKLLSDRWLPYELFFSEQRSRYMAFLNAAETDQLNPANAVKPKIVEKTEEETEEPEEGEAEDGNEEDDEAKKAKRAAAEAERKAVDRGLNILEALFPKAGWHDLASYPDLYPYFSDVFKWKRDYALIAPGDPLQQVAALIRILEELFFGIRFISFGTVTGPDGNSEQLDDTLVSITNNWHYYNETSFEKEYLPRLSEYCHILENASDSRGSNYAKRLLNELHWLKRLYFFPYYKFESTFPPSFQKRDITPLYPEIRALRRYLTAAANSIEQGIKRGGAEKRAPCDGINNPWDPYVFQIPNPLSIRLNALLEEKKRNNASLLFYILAITVVLDNLVNHEDSWAYSGGDRGILLFRSEDGGATPLLGVDAKINTEALFKQSLKRAK